MSDDGSPSLADRARELEWVLLDVDGVFTDGGLHYSGEGESLKRFDVRDGLGLKLLQAAGLRVGLLSGRRSPPLENRAAELKLDAVILGQRDKGTALDVFLEDFSTTESRVAYVGDDLPDLPVLRRCALAFAPADAVPEVRGLSGVRVLERAGGRGAVRELAELLLRARGDWDATVDRFR